METMYMIMDLSLGVIAYDRLTLEEALQSLAEDQDFALLIQHDKDVNPFLECDFCTKRLSTLREEG